MFWYLSYNTRLICYFTLLLIFILHKVDTFVLLSCHCYPFLANLWSIIVISICYHSMAFKNLIICLGKNFFKTVLTFHNIPISMSHGPCLYRMKKIRFSNSVSYIFISFAAFFSTLFHYYFVGLHELTSMNMSSCHISILFIWLAIISSFL